MCSFLYAVRDFFFPFLLPGFNRTKENNLLTAIVVSKLTKLFNLFTSEKVGQKGGF